MLISKFDLYKTEWLDLVFDDRNKDYGAYNLRQHYASTMVKAMGITFFSVAVLFGASILLKTEKPIIHVTQVDETVKPPVLPAVKKIDKPKVIQHPKPEPLKTVATIKDPPAVVVPDKDSQTPVKNDQLKGVVIGQTTLKGDPGEVEIPVDKPSNGGGTAPAVDDKLYTPYSGLEQMPEPEGGMNAWSKFLNKNLRFPPEAQEENISGKVWLSFIIEKDGHLSNIVVDRGAGHGFDEEALRVLKLAKAWKPGKQNGQAVRVKYSIPINFQLSGE